MLIDQSTPWVMHKPQPQPQLLVKVVEGHRVYAPAVLVDQYTPLVELTRATLPLLRISSRLGVLFVPLLATGLDHSVLTDVALVPFTAGKRGRGGWVGQAEQ